MSTTAPPRPDELTAEDLALLRRLDPDSPDEPVCVMTVPRPCALPATWQARCSQCRFPLPVCTLHAHAIAREVAQFPSELLTCIGCGMELPAILLVEIVRIGGAS